MRIAVPILAGAAFLVACEPTIPVSPRAPLVARSGLHPSVAYGERLAWRECAFDWGGESYGGVFCYLDVSPGDGTVRRYGGIAYGDEQLNNPSWSPDGTRIAVDNNWSIEIVTLDDSTTQPLMSDGLQAWDPAWSPDGSRIAFTSSRGGSTDLYVVNVDGSNIVQVTDHVGFGGNASWFPDGTRLVFDCHVDADNADVCAINADGSGFTRLTTDATIETTPAISPDGARIAFSTTRFSPNTGAQDIAIANLDLSNVVQLTHNGRAFDPSWSPGGGRLAYTQGASGACETYCDNHLRVIDADGTNDLFWGGGSTAQWRPSAGDVPRAPDDPPVANLWFHCDGLRCDFESGMSTDDHSVAGYAWNFGDGTTSTRDHEYHTYAAAGTYDVTLTVYDAANQSDTETISVIVAIPDAPPVAYFDGSCAGLTCSFDSSPSSDDHGIVSRYWSFGDGGYAVNVVTTTHKFPMGGGRFDVSLTVTDGTGRTTTYSVLMTASDQSPIATFTWSCAGSTCTFDAGGSSDDVGITSYSWDFGNLGTATGKVAKLSMTGTTTFLASLTVRDGAGHASDVAYTVTSK